MFRKKKEKEQGRQIACACCRCGQGEGGREGEGKEGKKHGRLYREKGDKKTFSTTEERKRKMNGSREGK